MPDCDWDIRVNRNFLNRDVPFVEAVLRSIEEGEALNQAAALLYEAEVRHGIAFLEVPVFFASDRDPDDDWSSRALQPFLDETHFLLTGAAAQELGPYDAKGFSRMYSWRHWGAEMAEWANRHITPPKWKSGRDKPWEYITFYSAGYVPVESYLEWERALRRVINRKTAIYGWTFAPRLISYSARKLRKLPWYPGQIQLVEGGVHPSLPPVGEQVRNAVIRLSQLLQSYVFENRLGTFYPEGTRFVVSSEPDTVLGPPGAFISRERKPVKSRTGWIPMVPDIVIEATSQLDVNRRLDQKIDWWLAAGVPVVWVVDADLRQVTIHSQSKMPVTASSQESLPVSEILPGFDLPVENLFS